MTDVLKEMESKESALVALDGALQWISLVPVSTLHSPASTMHRLMVAFAMQSAMEALSKISPIAERDLSKVVPKGVRVEALERLRRLGYLSVIRDDAGHDRYVRMEALRG